MNLLSMSVCWTIPLYPRIPVPLLLSSITSPLVSRSSSNFFFQLVMGVFSRYFRTAAADDSQSKKSIDQGLDASWDEEMVIILNPDVFLISYGFSLAISWMALTIASWRFPSRSSFSLASSAMRCLISLMSISSIVIVCISYSSWSYPYSSGSPSGSDSSSPSC